MSGTSSGGPSRRLRLAYLNTRYPALSHTFIQREIEALRIEDVEVIPISIRKPTIAELGAGADGGEIARTIYLLDRPMLAGWIAAGAALAAPLRTLRVLAASQRLSPDGLRMRLRHIAYAVEALLLARQMRRRGLTEIHVHMANNGAMVGLLAAVFDRRIAYSLTIHGSAEFFDVHRLRLREKAENARFVRFISHCGRAQIMALTNPDTWPRFHVVHCGIELSPPAPRAPNPGQTIHVLAIGRLTPVKGYPVLLAALKELSSRGVPWDLRVAGDGTEKAYLETLAGRLDIADRVKFLGPLPPEKIRAELDHAGVLVVSSFMEGIPVVLMEAMAGGVPVVSTSVGGVPELVANEFTGLLVTPGTPEPLASALFEVWSDPAAARSRAEAARRKVEHEFDVRESARRLRALFEQYARGNGRESS